jgi:hypothetical protein
MRDRVPFVQASLFTAGKTIGQRFHQGADLDFLQEFLSTSGAALEIQIC